MATTAIQRLRRDVGLALDDTASLSNADAQDLLDEAAEVYSGAAADAYARILYLRGKLASSSEEVDYTQNESRESAGQKFGHLERLLQFWESELANAGGVGAAIFKVY